MLGGGPWLLPSPCTPSFERLSSRGEIPVEHFQREPATEQQRKAEVLQPCPRPHVLPLLLLRRQPDHSCQDFRLRSQLAAAGGGWCRACETPSEVPKLADPDGQGQQPANDGRDGRRLSVQGRALGYSERGPRPRPAPELEWPRARCWLGSSGRPCTMQGGPGQTETPPALACASKAGWLMPEGCGHLERLLIGRGSR